MRGDGQKPIQKYRIYQVMNVKRKMKVQGALRGSLSDREVLFDNNRVKKNHLIYSFHQTLLSTYYVSGSLWRERMIILGNTDKFSPFYRAFLF